MQPKELLDSTAHRPWEIPTKNWRFYQEWKDAVFVHWQVPLNEIKKFVPEDIEIDLFEGKAWVSLVAFSMEKLRRRNLPSVPAISDFNEINLRTYVKYKGKPGVYFLSIEGGSKISCKVAKKIAELPYRFSAMKRGKESFQSFNKEFNDHLYLKYRVLHTLHKKEPIDLWLTERYALFQDSQNGINEFEIHHVEWPLQNVDITKIDLEYERFKNLIDNHPSKIAYSKGVQVVAWRKNC